MAAARWSAPAVIFVVGTLLYLLAIQPVAWLTGLSPGGEPVATGKARVSTCSTGLGKLWVLHDCLTTVTWLDGKVETRIVQSTRVLTGDVDVVEWRGQNWSKSSRSAYSYTVAPADHRAGTHPLWGWALGLGGYAALVGIVFLVFLRGNREGEGE